MEKIFNYNGEEIKIVKKSGYGQYGLYGLGTSVHCTDSEIWDYCDDDEHEDRMNEAQKAAHEMLSNNL